MPDTETVELRTDTVEQLADLLDSKGLDAQYKAMPADRRRAVADRLRNSISSPDAVAFCGLPGAGKSYTAEKVADVYDAVVVSMGDAIREEYDETFDEDNPASEELGAFAANWREEAAEEIPEKVAEMAGETGEELVIIDGVRSTTDYEVLNDYFDDFYLIEVQAEFYTRLSRLQERGREGEAAFTAVDLAERDERERNDLGLGDLIEADHPDMNIKNGTGPDKLENRLSLVVEENLPFDVVNEEPIGPLKGTLTIQAGGGPVGE